MSLLLEALKKAEKAKEDAQRRAKEAKADAEPNPVEEAPSGAKSAGGVRTRDQLPDISRPLEILSDDIAPNAPGGRTEPSLALEQEPAAPTESPAGKASAGESARTSASARSGNAPRAARAAGARGATADPQANQRAGARKVFEAKFKEPNPRLPFYITLGVLGAFAIGIVVYFWYQLRPPPSLVNLTPPAAAEQPAQVVQAIAQPSTPPRAPTSIPGLPPAGASSAMSQPAPAAPVPPRAAPPKAAPPAALAAAPAATAASRPVQPAAAEPAVRAPKAATPAPRPAPEGAPVAASRPVPRVDPRVEAAFGAYQAGNLELARESYQAVLRDEPANRDALLGLAAVEMRTQRYEAAEAHYRRLLQANPRDPHAQAGMLALRSEQVDPVLAESRVKSLLATDPEATVLYFTLGNQFALQERWAEAQQAYFKAFAADPDNADFAYNLAVSLDHLRQPKLALEHYRRALALAQVRSASFDADAARRRVQELSR